jgi:hypothetical protein
VAIGAEPEGHARYASNESGKWLVTDVGENHGASSVRLALDGLEKPHFVYVDRDYRLHTAEPSGQGFTVRDETPLADAFLVNQAGTLRWLYNDFEGVMVGQRDLAGNLTFSLLAAESSVMAAESADPPYLAVSPNASEQPATLALGRAVPGALDLRTLWTQDNPRFKARETVHASMAAGHDGSVWVAHVEPKGISLAQVNDGQVTRSELVAEAVPPVLVVDRKGEPHVLFHALDEIRHVFRGKCPAPGSPARP